MARKETDIQIGGRFWSTTVDGKIVDASQVEGLEDALNLNLKNGSGESSLQSTSTKNYDGSAYDTDQKKIEATGHESFAFGRDCKATGTRSFAFGSYNISSGNASFVTGQENTASNSSNFIAGRKNIVDRPYASAIGTFLKGGRENGLVIGQYNKGINDAIFEVGYGTSETDRKNALHINANNGNIYVDRNILFSNSSVAESKKNVIAIGFNNYHSTGTTLTVGAVNRITHDLEDANSAAIGCYNTVTSTNALAVGVSNKVKGYAAVALGSRLETADVTGQVVVGTFNKINSDAKFIVGIGNDSARNAFEVLLDGRAKVYTKPEEDEDVVRLIDLKQVSDNLVYVTDNDIEALWA